MALLTPTYWPEVRRGTERTVHDLAVGLRGRGHRPRILTTAPRCPGPGRAVEDGVEVVRLPRPAEALLGRRGIQEHAGHMPLARAALASGSDDLAHAFHVTDGAVAAAWSQRSGRPAVFSFMGLPERASLSNRRGRVALLRRALEGCAATVALSSVARDALGRWLGVEAHVIHPGVDLDPFTPDLGTRDPEPLILCTAALEDPRKRVDLLLAALALVRRARPRTRLVLLRPGDARLAAALTATAGVELVPNDAAALPALYRRAWVTALPSRAEAFGLVLVESLASGTPGVGARDGGAAEILDGPRVGATFAGDEPAALAAALLAALDLAEDPSTAAACRTRAGLFSATRAVDEHLALYAELLAT